MQSAPRGAACGVRRSGSALCARVYARHVYAVRVDAAIAATLCCLILLHSCLLLLMLLAPHSAHAVTPCLMLCGLFLRHDTLFIVTLR